ncbi:helix-turn-helix transcriptional regulator [Streptomyces sp. NPDC058195]|uniref:helix-turn-helix transcriptional regulator n=1 Tax=Streptomyces sp. NPDC058195 TaxID=3346375 RepID=UPI0036E1470D
MTRGTAKFDASILRQLRTSKEVGGRLLSAADLAALLKTSKARVLAYEQEKSVPEPGRVREMANIFQVPARELYQARPAGHVDQIRDLRCYAGLTSAEFAQLIGLSRTTYRDIENRAVLPTHDDGTLPLKMATALRLPLGMIRRALDHHPAAVRRRAIVTAHLVEVFQLAKVTHRPALIDPDEELLIRIAEQLRRPASVVCRLVNHDLGRYRDLLRRHEIAQVNVAYAQGSREARVRTKELEELRANIDRHPGAVAAAQLRFLAEAMSAQQWRMMVDLLQRSGRTYDFGTTLNDPNVGHAWNGLLVRGFVAVERDPNSVLALTVTHYGLGLCRTQRPYYACLYPRITAPYAVLRQSFSRSARLARRSPGDPPLNAPPPP